MMPSDTFVGMKYLIRLFLVFFLVFSMPPLLEAQDTDIESQYTALTETWLEYSEQLKSYEGLCYLCDDKGFRQNTFTILNQLHHYDSLILDVLLDPTIHLEISHREYQKTIKEIQKFEEEYSIKSMIRFLKESCLASRDLEKNKETYLKESGVYSYDGQILMLETQLHKYMKQIDKRVSNISKHLHRIDGEQITFNDQQDSE